MSLSIEVVGPAGERRTEVVAQLVADGFTSVRAAGAAADPAPEVAVLVSDAPADERIAAARDLAARRRTAGVVTTMPADATTVQLRNAMRAGANGIVLDDRVAQMLGATVLSVHAGQIAAPVSLARRLAPPALSHRERETLALVVRGFTNRQIAAELFLAESTVKTHLSSALRKLDARSRAEAAAIVLDRAEGHDLLLAGLAGDPRKIETAQAV